MACRRPRPSSFWPFSIRGSRKIQFQEESLIIPNASRCFIQQLVRRVDFTLVSEAGGQGSRRMVVSVQVLARSVLPPEAPLYLQPESTLEKLFAVPALVPAVEDSSKISRGFLTFCKLRQTFKVNEASAVPAACASPHELRRFPAVISFKANVASFGACSIGGCFPGRVRSPFPPVRTAEASCFGVSSFAHAWEQYQHALHLIQRKTLAGSPHSSHLRVLIAFAKFVSCSGNKQVWFRDSTRRWNTLN